MIKTEGPASLYRGILPPIMVEAPKRATKFAANEQYTSLYKKLFGFEKVTQSLSVLTGVSAGLTEAVIIVPFELVKVRMQDKANVSKKRKKESLFLCYLSIQSLVNTMARQIQSERFLLLKAYWRYLTVLRLPCGVMRFGMVPTLV
jgi:hypothetical protein